MSHQCPHDASPLTIQETEGHIGFLCASCGGAWLPRQYLESIGQLRKFAAEKFLQTLGAQLSFRSTLQCPNSCGALQRKTVKGIDIEYCPACQGIWFDRGEIEALLKDLPHRDGGSGEKLDGFDIADIGSALLDLLQ